MKWKGKDKEEKRNENIKNIKGIRSKIYYD
jgi:hypothetical protein